MNIKSIRYLNILILLFFNNSKKNIGLQLFELDKIPNIYIFETTNKSLQFLYKNKTNTKLQLHFIKQLEYDTIQR
jgi:hypothetical protein